MWDKTKYDNIDMIKLEAHEIWMPDLYNSNMAPEAHETLGGESLMIHVNSLGNVLAVFASTLVVGCIFNERVSIRLTCMNISFHLLLVLAR